MIAECMHSFHLYIKSENSLENTYTAEQNLNSYCSKYKELAENLALQIDTFPLLFCKNEMPMVYQFPSKLEKIFALYLIKTFSIVHTILTSELVMVDSKYREVRSFLEKMIHINQIEAITCYIK